MKEKNKQIYETPQTAVCVELPAQPLCNASVDQAMVYDPEPYFDPNPITE